MEDTRGNNDGKRNWRDRLGISGENELPKLADKFAADAKPRPAPVTPSPTQQAAVAASRATPMAPRPQSRATPAPAAPRAPTSAAPMVATQRPAVSSGKPKFVFIDSNNVEEEAPAAAPAPRPQQQAAAPAPQAQRPVAPQAQRPVAPQQVAPQQAAPQQVARPQMQQPVPQRQPARPPVGFNPAMAAQQPRAYVPPRGPAVPPTTGYQAYRPINPATGQPQPGYRPQRPVVNAGGSLAPQAPQRVYVPPRAPAQMASYQNQPQFDDASPLPPEQMLGTPQAGMHDDFFEDSPKPQRQATVSKYQQAYQDEFAGEGEEEPRSSMLGIWLTVGVFAALLALGGFWFLRDANNNGATATKPAVVEAPAAPAKTAPAPVAAAPAEQAGKKLIYDRIEGDHEVPGGALKQSEQAPAPPAAAGTPAVAPMPLPPPPPVKPGQRGDIDTPSGTNQQANIEPAAAPPPAADSSVGQDLKGTDNSGSNMPPLPPPPSATVPPATPAAQQPATPTPAAKPAKAATPAKPKAEAATNDKSLGSKPVVLVPPAKISNTKQVASAAPAPANGSDIYGNADTTPAPAEAASPAPKGGYVAQLSSFSSKEEALAEYKRLASVHGPIITRYAPQVTPVQVGGATRYRLGLGPIATSDTASQLCSSLLAAGERDCVAQQR